MILHVKLNSGADLLGIAVNESKDHISLEKPIQVIMSPTDGVFIKDWLFLSEETVLVLDKSHVLFSNIASQKGIEYYDEFYSKGKTTKSVPEDNDLLDIFESLVESKSSTKH